MLDGDRKFSDLLRRRCQTDLLFLADVLGYHKMVPRIHSPVAQHAVQKKPELAEAISDHEELMNAQDPGFKQRLHMDPRKCFKTTLGIVDDVQWIICFPNVRICKLTATKPLAAAVAGEIAQPFVKATHEMPSLFQALFPEFVITPRDRKVGQFRTPNRTIDWKEETVMSFSIETSISGWHFDVMDVDDVVDTQNSKTATGIQLVKNNWRINKKTLMAWGYTNFKGTRYNPMDLWGDIIKKANPARIKVLLRSALSLKSGKRLEPGDFPARDEMELNFPELLSYEHLKDEFDDDYSSFMTQYMNDAHGGNEVTFTPETMLASTVDEVAVPVTGQIFIAWRLAYGGKENMRTPCGAVGLLYEGRLYVMELSNTPMMPSGLAHRIASLAKKYGSHRVTIEETPGAKNLEPAIHNYAATLGWTVQIAWVPFEEDDGARDLRLKALEPIIVSRRLLFSSGVKRLRDVHEEFTSYGMTDEFGLVDVIARLSDNLPKLIVQQESDASQDVQWEILRQKDLYDRTHGLGRYSLPVEAPVETYTPPRNSYGLDESLGGLNG